GAGFDAGFTGLTAFFCAVLVFEGFTGVFFIEEEVFVFLLVFLTVFFPAVSFFIITTSIKKYLLHNYRNIAQVYKNVNNF
ncbi:MAG: hypothetical protein FWC17_05745, partial [Treponema sp.]|nr:hypothetical protein [Treponema sp.]